MPFHLARIDGAQEVDWMKMGLAKLRAVLFWSLMVIGLFELFHVISFLTPNQVYGLPHQPYLAVVAPDSKSHPVGISPTLTHVLADIVSVWRYGV